MNPQFINITRFSAGERRATVLNTAFIVHFCDIVREDAREIGARTWMRVQNEEDAFWLVETPEEITAMLR